MLDAPPGSALFAGPDDLLDGLCAALAPRPVVRSHDDDVRVAVLWRHPAPAAFLAAWRADPATAAVPVLALGDDPHGADSCLPCDVAPAVLRSHVDLLARAGRALRDSEALYHSLVETLPVAIFRKDLDGRFTFVNSPFCAELRRSPAEILGRRDADFFPPDLADKYVRDDRRVVESVRVFECVEGHATAEGDARHVHVIKTPLHDSAGDVIGMQGIFWDVTDRIKAQEELARAAADAAVARRVQRALFPSPRSPAVRRAAAAGFDLGGGSFPVDAVGGDYYDFFDQGDGRLAAAVGDVSGHGSGPAILMAVARAYLHALTRGGGPHCPGEVLRRANELLAADVEGDRYVTLLLLSLDLERRSLRYASAGHATAYVLDSRDEIKNELQSTGVPLGVHPASEFEVSGEIALEPGDAVVLLTDGVVEARDPSRQTFGEARVLQTVRAYRWAGAAQVVENLYHAVRAFSQYQPQLDDVTAAVVKVTG